MLVLAYADWCGHCKTFKPIWNDFKRKYGKVLDVRELNADKDGETIKEMNIQGFPTIFMLKGGYRHEFEGQRNIAGLEKFVKGVTNDHLKDNLKTYKSRK